GGRVAGAMHVPAARYREASGTWTRVPAERQRAGRNYRRAPCGRAALRASYEQGGRGERYRSIGPHRVALVPQLHGQALFHIQRFGTRKRSDVLVETGAEVATVLPHDVAAELVALRAAGTCAVLHEPFLRSLAGHPHVQAFQHTVVLRIGRSEAPMLLEDLARQLNDIDRVHDRHGTKIAWPGPSCGRRTAAQPGNVLFRYPGMCYSPCAWSDPPFPLRSDHPDHVIRTSFASPL